MSLNPLNRLRQSKVTVNPAGRAAQGARPSASAAADPRAEAVPAGHAAAARAASSARAVPGSRPATPRYGVSTKKKSRRGPFGRKAKPTKGAPDGAAAPEEPKEQAFLARAINNWWNRLIGSVFGGGFASESEQYLAHQTKRDYVLNSVGQACWGGLFPLLTMVCTWLVGAEKAGAFSMAFTVGTLLLFLANYGVRTYQVSDLDEMQSFLDYQVNRFVTCALMLAVGWLWCQVKGYDTTMFQITMWVLVFRAVDGLADVYEGRLQQKDKLYLAGLSQGVRCVMAFVAFSVVLLLTRSLPVASIALAVGAIASLLLLTVPLACFETDKSLPLSLSGVRDLFVECFPLFLALFLYNLIDSVPKFAMEGALSYDNQLYYNALYFPAHTILMVAAMIYKPQLVRLAKIWDDPEKHKRFDLLVLAMIGVIAVITAVMALFMGWIGIPLMGILYGLDFEKYRSLAYVMVGTGGLCACIDFLYQIITVLRAQEQVSRLYLIAFVFAVPVCILLVNFAELAGAVMGSLVSMAILLVLLVTEYFAIRKRLRAAY